MDLRSVQVATPDDVVRTTLGVNHHVGALKAEVLMRLGRTPVHHFEGYDLITEDGDYLDDEHTLGSAGVEDGDDLYLDPPTGSGI